MEPVSLSVTTIATLLLTKALEKTGEALGEKALNQFGTQISKLKQVLQRKSPDTATTIETVAQQPNLAEVNPGVYSSQALAERLQNLANSDSEIAEAVKSVADAVYANPQSVQSLTNIANKIGVVAPGSVFTGDLNF
ncbi:hypothetical protein NDA01_29350 [Trichocoleus desertorum AS-A10]|uniref:hypothetical protein n=1 Tax=Trichocoleus desertorum TaxID=1481672 RepID=UPI00329703AD